MNTMSYQILKEKKSKYDPKKLFPKTYNNFWFENEESTDKKIWRVI